MAEEKEKTVIEKSIDFVKENFENCVVDGNHIKRYTDTKNEYNALRKGAGIRNISANAVIELNGEDVLPFLNRISTNDMSDLEINQTRKTLFTNPEGGILGRTSLLRFEERNIVLGSFENNQRLSHWIRNFMTDEKLKIQDLTGNYLILEFFGPQAESFLTVLCGKEIEELNLHCIKTFNAEGFVFHLIKTLDAAGNTKFWLMLLNPEIEKFLELILNSKSVFEVKMVGEEAFNIFRIEEGIPVIGSELTAEFSPVEANLEAEVNFEKGNFIGSEKMKKRDEFVRRNVLTGFVLEENNFEKLPVYLLDSKGNVLGAVTSICESIRLEKSIGLGYISEELAGEEKVKLFDDYNNKITLELSKVPFK